LFILLLSQEKRENINNKNTGISFFIHTIPFNTGGFDLSYLAVSTDYK